MSRSTRFVSVPLIAILLLAFALRIWALDQHSLWFDEGVSLTFAGMSLHDVYDFSKLWQDVNPPAYRVMLGWWVRVVGITVFTARYWSVLLGMLSIALAARIGRSIGLHKFAIYGAALWLALSPMQVFYSREAKGYTFVQLFLLLILWMWLRIWRKTRRGGTQTSVIAELLVTAAATALAIGAHYISLLVIAGFHAGVLFTALWGHSRHLRAWIQWTMGQAVGVLAWGWWIVGQAGTTISGTRDAVGNVGLIASSPFDYLVEMWAEFVSGPIATGVLAALASGVILLLVIAGFWSARRSKRQMVLLGMWILIPLLLGFFAQLIVPFFYPRFLLTVTPALALLIGVSIEWLGRQINAPLASVSLTGLIMVVTGVQSMQALTPDTEPDTRPISAYLAEHVQPGDALLYSYSWQPGMLEASIPPDDIHPEYYPTFFPEAETASSLEAILSDHGRVWLLTFDIAASDPTNDVGMWLRQHAATTGGSWFDDSELTLFIDSDKTQNNDEPEERVSFNQGEIILRYVPLTVSREQILREPLVIALEWEAARMIEARYVVFVHVIAPPNPIPLAQQDTEPVNALSPTYSWQVGVPVTDLHAVSIPAQLPDGDLQILVGLYDADTLERLPVDQGGDSVQIGVIK